MPGHVGCVLQCVTWNRWRLADFGRMQSHTRASGLYDVNPRRTSMTYNSLSCIIVLCDLACNKISRKTQTGSRGVAVLV
ncbi:hypothetical protein E2C01_065569 [Portunus trituberculatus]|uniref:Uncharacterized protein n=1 Tax=Portunus trituberculatus TaxID=210409 RepID=A0A5B7HMX0_PORTR|nr:hypothetical protein [Portunus trituberculatus]